MGEVTPTRATAAAAPAAGAGAAGAGAAGPAGGAGGGAGGGRAAFRAGDFAAAERAFSGELAAATGRRGRGDGAGAARALLNRSAARAGREDWQGSLADAAAAARRAPQDLRAWFRAGKALLELREAEQAARAFQFGLALVPGNQQLADGLELARAMQRAEYRRRRADEVQEARERAAHERLGRLGVEEREAETARDRETRRRRDSARWLHEERCERDRIARDAGWKAQEERTGGEKKGGKDPFLCLYGVLGVRPQASPEELRRAYLKRLPLVHPDKGGDAAEFLLLQRAYDELSDPDRRGRHDDARAARASGAG